MNFPEGNRYDGNFTPKSPRDYENLTDNTKNKRKITITPTNQGKTRGKRNITPASKELVEKIEDMAKEEMIAKKEGIQQGAPQNAERSDSSSSPTITPPRSPTISPRSRPFPVIGPNLETISKQAQEQLKITPKRSDSWGGLEKTRTTSTPRKITTTREVSGSRGEISFKPEPTIAEKKNSVIKQLQDGYKEIEANKIMLEKLQKETSAEFKILKSPKDTLDLPILQNALNKTKDFVEMAKIRNELTALSEGELTKKEVQNIDDKAVQKFLETPNDCSLTDLRAAKKAVDNVFLTVEEVVARASANESFKQFNEQIEHEVHASMHEFNQKMASGIENKIRSGLSKNIESNSSDFDKYSKLKQAKQKLGEEEIKLRQEKASIKKNEPENTEKLKEFDTKIKKKEEEKNDADEKMRNTKTFSENIQKYSNDLKNLREVDLMNILISNYDSCAQTFYEKTNVLDKTVLTHLKYQLLNEINNSLEVGNYSKAYIIVIFLESFTEKDKAGSIDPHMDKDYNKSLGIISTEVGKAATTGITNSLLKKNMVPGPLMFSRLIDSARQMTGNGNIPDTITLQLLSLIEACKNAENL